MGNEIQDAVIRHARSDLKAMPDASHGVEHTLGGLIMHHLKERLLAIVPEAMETLTDKVIPQGAAEIAQGLYLGNCYTPYGPAQEPVPVEPPQQPEQQSYADMVREAAMRTAPERDRGMSR